MRFGGARPLVRAPGGGSTSFPQPRLRVAAQSSRLHRMTDSHLPPRPHAALRVGVTGHRLNRLLEPDVDLEAVRTCVTGVLAEIRDRTEEVIRSCRTLYAGPPVLRVI